MGTGYCREMFLPAALDSSLLIKAVELVFAVSENAAPAAMTLWNGHSHRSQPSVAVQAQIPSRHTTPPDGFVGVNMSPAAPQMSVGTGGTTVPPRMLAHSSEPQLLHPKSSALPSPPTTLEDAEIPQIHSKYHLNGRRTALSRGTLGLNTPNNTFGMNECWPTNVVRAARTPSPLLCIEPWP